MWTPFLLLLWAAGVGSDFFLGERHEHGFIPIDVRYPQYKLFYWLFKSRSRQPNPPLVVWIEGGPGCSSEGAIYVEHGPYRLGLNDSSVESNPYSWNNNADIMFIDQPLGTGFSNCSDQRRIPSTSEQTAEDFYGFFTNFLAAHSTEYNPQTTKVYFAGQSYGGHFLPAIVSTLLRRNFPFRIAGCSLGNPYVSPDAVMWSYPRFAYRRGLISYPTYAGAVVAQNVYEILNKIGWETAAFFFSSLVNATVVGLFTPNFMPYDIRGTDMPFQQFDTFMKARLKRELGLSDREWESCNGAIPTEIMTLDQIHDCSAYVDEILARGIPVVFYYGAEDFVCNSLSWERTLDGFSWPGVEEFRRQPLRQYWANGKLKGEQRQYKNLWYIRVFNAGHIVFYNDPEFGFDLLTRLFQQT